MIRASHRSSEGCWFDPSIGLRNRFLRSELNESLSIFQDISKLPYFQHTYRINNVNISWLLHRHHICRTHTIACHLSPSGSLVWVAYWSSEGRGFDRCLGPSNRFSDATFSLTIVQRTSVIYKVIQYGRFCGHLCVFIR